MKNQVSMACPAKVNLSLRVRGRRPDGYHAITTVLQTIDLCDRLTVRRIDPDRPLGLEVPGGGAPDDDSNLVVTAARTFFEAIGEPARGFRFELKKRIPAGSGLGGGSSDAAGTLAALQKLRGEPLGTRELLATAAAVGSDVPFFLVGGTVLAAGRGEKLRALEDIAAASVIVAVPAVEVAAAEVYRHWRPPRAECGSDREESTSGPIPERASRRLGDRREERKEREEDVLPPPARVEAASWLRGNDLEPVARRLYPEVDRLFLALRSAPLGASDRGPQVSGSGGAVFGIGRWKGAERVLAGLDVNVIRTSTLRRSRAAESNRYHPWCSLAALERP